MRIIIPMAGNGDRFVRAGHDAPKPLIEVDGAPMIQHVIAMFPGETDFLFICNNRHLDETDMRSVLRAAAPGCEIVGIEPHKEGPVRTVLGARDRIGSGETIICYCDFGMFWDYSDFLRDTRARGADGAIPAYRGFHPHMLGPTNYAFMRESNRWMLEIREKQPFTDNRNNEFASTGLYYFKTGAHALKYFDELIESGADTMGEYYASMPFNYMARDGLKVSIYEVQHMLQWGAPSDLEEYQAWSDYFRRAATGPDKSKREFPGAALMPMAGTGERFAREGFAELKQLTPVGGVPMFARAASNAPACKRRIFAALKEHVESRRLGDVAKSFFPNAEICEISEKTDGQASTCAMAIESLDRSEPLHIVSCDSAPAWDAEKYAALTGDESADAAIWTFRRNTVAARSPEMYGWVRADEEGNALEVSVKKPVSDDPYNDRGITGAFYFRKAEFFSAGYSELLKRNERINGEFYVDSLMNELIRLGMRVKVFEVDCYASFGTPDELRVCEYWRSFFHKSGNHPYSLFTDTSVPADAAEALDREYRTFSQYCE